jgi:hypothetical protein
MLVKSHVHVVIDTLLAFSWRVLTSPPHRPDRGPLARHTTRDWPLLDATRLKTQEPAALFHLPFNIALNILFFGEKKTPNGITTIADGCGRLGSIPQVDGLPWVLRRNVWVARPVYPPYFPFVIFLGNI